jgi:hypothetical protein
MEDDEEEEEEGDVGSPSPPFELVHHEEAEKQLESQGGDFERNNDLDELDDKVNIQIIHI